MQDYRKMTIQELRQKCQATAPEAGRDPFVGLTIRFFSIFLTRLFIRTSITPNQVTVLSVLVFMSGMSLFATESYLAHLVGVCIVYFSIILDGCDGEIARLKGNKSGVGGIYTEPVSHDIQYGFMFFPISLGVYFLTQNPLFIYVGFVAVVAKLLNRFLIVRFDQVQLYRKLAENPGWRPIKQRVEFNKNPPWYHKLYRFLNRNFFGSVGLMIPLTLFALLNRMDIFLWCFAIFFVGSFSLHFIKQMMYISNLSEAKKKNFTSVVLAAGIGSRLGNLTKETPKPLLSVDGRTILDYIIAWLHFLGTKKIIVVGGYMFDTIKSAVEKMDSNAILVENKEFASSHRMISLLKAKGLVEGDMLIQDADYIYHKKVKEVIDATECKEITVFASREKSEYMVQDVIASTDDATNLIHIFKTVGTQELSSTQEYYFNSLVYVPENKVSLFFDIAEQMIAVSGKMIHVEDTLLEYVKRGNVVKVINAGTPLWIEIDKPDELEAGERFIKKYKEFIP
jgi:choline kinase